MCTKVGYSKAADTCTCSVTIQALKMQKYMHELPLNNFLDIHLALLSIAWFLSHTWSATFLLQSLFLSSCTVRTCAVAGILLWRTSTPTATYDSNLLFPGSFPPDFFALQWPTAFDAAPLQSWRSILLTSTVQPTDSIHSAGPVANSGCPTMYPHLPEEKYRVCAIYSDRQAKAEDEWWTAGKISHSSYTHSKACKLAVQLAKEAIFGEDVLAKCTVGGFRDLPALPLHELNKLKQLMFAQLPSYWQTPQEFETLWCAVTEAVGKACKGLSKKTPSPININWLHRNTPAPVNIGWLFTCIFIV